MTPEVRTRLTRLPLTHSRTTLLVAAMLTVAISTTPANAAQPTASNRDVAAIARNACGSSYKVIKRGKQHLYNTDSATVGNGLSIVSRSNKLGTVCIIGTSTGELSRHLHGGYASFCLQPAEPGSCEASDYGLRQHIVRFTRYFRFIVKLPHGHGHFGTVVQTTTSQAVGDKKGHEQEFSGYFSY